MTANPGVLKLDLVVHGSRVDESVHAHPEIFRAPWVRAYVSRAIELVLPEDVWVSVPLGETFTERSPYELRRDGDRFRLARDGEDVEVRVVPQPEYYARTTSSGLPMWKVGTSYGGYIAINPAATCHFEPLGLSCRFCDPATRGVERHEPIPVADVVETVRAAFAEGAVEFVYFYVGFHEGDDSGVRFLEPYVDAIKKHFDTLVAVQLHPPRDMKWVDRAYAMGVDAVSYGIEIYDPELLARHCAGRTQLVGRERYFEALSRAATIFPSGTVWSNLIVGLEPAESTIRGIDALVDMGVLPVLSLFRPLDDIELRDHPVPTTAEVEPIFAHLFQTVRRARINMNWVRDLSFAITPLEARYFVDDPSAAAAARTFYRSRIGSLAARNLSRMRRRLRVRTVSNSFDSSNL